MTWLWDNDGFRAFEMYTWVLELKEELIKKAITNWDCMKFAIQGCFSRMDKTLFATDYSSTCIC